MLRQAFEMSGMGICPSKPGESFTLMPGQCFGISTKTGRRDSRFRHSGTPGTDNFDEAVPVCGETAQFSGPAAFARD
jgi:hypothetical protein